MDISCILCGNPPLAPEVLGIAYTTFSCITEFLFTDLSLSRVPVNILSFYQLVLSLLRAIEVGRTRAAFKIITASLESSSFERTSRLAVKCQIFQLLLFFKAKKVK